MAAPSLPRGGRKRVSVVARVVSAVTAAHSSKKKKLRKRKCSRKGISPRPRLRRSVAEVYSILGGIYFRRAYRMTYYSFCTLHRKLEEGIRVAVADLKPPQKGGRNGGRYKPPPVPNGPIASSMRLACWLRMASGASPYYLMVKYGISHTAVFDSLWYVTTAINSLDEFSISYPSSRDEQRTISADFRSISTVKFGNCGGAIYGILIWMSRPSEKDARRTKIGRKKRFLCARKHNFGLNCMAVSGVRERILDISIIFGGSSADCVAFQASDLYARLEKGLLTEGRVLFGDNAYLNSVFMTTPYPGIRGGSKDHYNFFSICR
jgi:hypothetical protein